MYLLTTSFVNNLCKNNKGTYIFFVTSDNFKKKRVHFCTKSVPYDGVPFVLVGRLELDCLFGRDKHKCEKERRKNKREKEMQVNIFVCNFSCPHSEGGI